MNVNDCVVSSPVACNDIFVIDVLASGFSPTDNSFNQNFTYLGETYNAKLSLSGLSTLTDAACTAVLGAGNNGCIGFTTVERQPNTFQASLQINSVPSPVLEPASLAIFGFGLTGLGFMRRRRLS